MFQRWPVLCSQNKFPYNFAMRFINHGRKVPTGWVTFCFGWDIKPRAYWTSRVGIIPSLCLAKLIYITGCPRSVFYFNKRKTCDIWRCYSGECEIGVLWCKMSCILIGICLCLREIYRFHLQTTRAILFFRGVDKSLSRPTPRCILFDGEIISFDASLVIYIVLIFLQLW